MHGERIKKKVTLLVASVEGWIEVNQQNAELSHNVG